MRFLDEYRNPELARRMIDKIRSISSKPWTIMEICGGQTHAIIKYGIDQLLEGKIDLLHGPGCPVCVTPIELIDTAVELALRKEVIFCSFGDMLRIPGTSSSLSSAKALGADIRMVYSPLDSLEIARENPDREVVFFAIGFETTAPANALTVLQANQSQIMNFSILTAQVLVPPAIEVILRSPECSVRGFLAAGHVCTVSGYESYETICQKYKIPFVVTGFEPLDILQGIYLVVSQLEKGQAFVENQYSRVVKRSGNIEAQEIMNRVFQITNREWRGLGLIPASGLELKEDYLIYDACSRFGIKKIKSDVLSECISGQILQGHKKPPECGVFGTRCTPEHPMGATMVSSEGACAAYFYHRRARSHADGQKSQEPLKQ